MILADDAVLFREGMARILVEVGFEVLGQARHGDELVELVRRDPPDVVITDLRMPPGFADEGIQAAVTIRSFAPQVGLSCCPSTSRFITPCDSWTTSTARWDTC